MMQHLTNERLQDYIHGELSANDDAATYAHLEQCEACRAEYEAELAIGESLRAYAAASQRELPGAVKAAIWNDVRAAQPSTWSRFVSSLRPVVAVPVAAALAAGIYFGVTSLNGQGGPRIEAAYYLQDHAALNSTVPFSDRNVTPVDLESNAVTSEQRSIAVEATVYTADAAHR